MHEGVCPRFYRPGSLCLHLEPNTHTNIINMRMQAQQATVAAPPATAAAATVKEQLVAALAGTDRGIFGIPVSDVGVIWGQEAV